MADSDHSELPLSWPNAGSPPLTHAVLRTTPDDFAVDEQISIALSGSGEHLWLHIRKRGLNTDGVARALARAAGVPARAVSYAGMKDRHAVTAQWFSLHLPGREPPDLAAALPPGVEILTALRHARKLQRGGLTGNRFSIVLRECSGDRERLLERVAEIGRGGVPNYFGEQRFGRDSANLGRAAQMFRGESVRDHHLRGIYLSAARSLLFNQVLARRVAEGTWCDAIEGDVFILNGTNSFFVPEAIDDAIRRRLLEADIHPSGPLWGEGELPSRARVLALESEIGNKYSEFAAGLAHARLSQERRSLRLLPRDMTGVWTDATTFVLSFSLPAGSYATAVLRELASYRDAQGASRPDAAD